MKKINVVVVFVSLLAVFLGIGYAPEPYINKKRSCCLFYEGKIKGFDFSKVSKTQSQEGEIIYIPLYIKLNKKYRKDNRNDYKNFVSMVIEHFESWARVKVTSYQIDNSQSLYDFLSDYEGRINGIWIKYEPREQLE